ncbi:MAG: transporter, partial [Proteobacteria bacterium]
MTNFVLIFICLAVGQLLRKARLAPENAAATLNVVVLYLSLPAVVLLQLPPFLLQATYSWALAAPVALPWAALLLAWGAYAWWGRRRGWSSATIGALIIATGLGNTSFVGFPVLEALLGPPGVQVGLLVDQLGSFCALSTLGLW